VAVGRRAQLEVEPAEDLDPVDDLGRLGARGPGLHQIDLVVGAVDERAVAGGDQQHQRAQALDQIAGELAHIGALVGHAVHGAQRRPGVAVEQGRDQRLHLGGRGHAEQAVHLAEGDRALAERGQLLKHAQRVAHAAGGRAGDRLGHAILKLQLLSLGDPAQVPGRARHAVAREGEALAAREDRRRDLMHLRRRHNEDGVVRGLLERLQQRVERRRRQHMDLVDDIHFRA
jgi:hypothetical protein